MKDRLRRKGEDRLLAGHVDRFIGQEEGGGVRGCRRLSEKMAEETAVFIVRGRNRSGLNRKREFFGRGVDMSGRAGDGGAAVGMTQALSLSRQEKVESPAADRRDCEDRQ